ncbi:MAG: hypothetical protein KKF26_04060 [Chloroflexi bacterium]|nr:hypothetical protein [Chloroflexota bacterium]
MTTKIGINGFGRIGRLAMRVTTEKKADIDVAVVNDLTDTKTNAHLLKYDSSYGIYPGKVEASSDAIVVDGRSVKVLSWYDNEWGYGNGVIDLVSLMVSKGL